MIGIFLWYLFLVKINVTIKCKETHTYFLTIVFEQFQRTTYFSSDVYVLLYPKGPLESARVPDFAVMSELQLHSVGAEVQGTGAEEPEEGARSTLFLSYINAGYCWRASLILFPWNRKNF